jgi:hypothetical protein
MYFAFTTQRFLYQIDMLDHPGIDRSHLAGVMTTEEMIEVVQCGEIVLPAVIAITHPQSFVGMHIIKRQLALRQDFTLRARRRGYQSAAQEKQPDYRSFQQGSSR